MYCCPRKLNEHARDGKKSITRRQVFPARRWRHGNLPSRSRACLGTAERHTLSASASVPDQSAFLRGIALNEWSRAPCRQGSDLVPITLYTHQPHFPVAAAPVNQAGAARHSAFTSAKPFCILGIGTAIRATPAMGDSLAVRCTNRQEPLAFKTGLPVLLAS